ncbi:MAG TPA: flagellar hook-associated protein FlgK [Pirellulales bacterium]|jgi:flagellar hook-associated protein 1 FlgK|nr:flagellar hook-associated protein FlgK [Pirellulales bacterium]
MSLFSSIQVASGALQAAQIGLQVVGQNIANANSPNYAREEVQFAPGPTQQLGSVLLGTGVEVQGVTRQVDQFLQQRLNSATSDSTSTQLTQQTYTQLESLLNELGTNGLSSSLDDFFSSISDVLNQPESDSVRNLAVLKGQTVTQDINQLASQTNQLRSDLNDQVAQDAGSINSLLSQIGKLNIQIESAEGGGTSQSDAVGLADQRDNALSQLSQLMNVTTQSQSDGTVSVFSGGQFLVLEGTARSVAVSQSTNRGLTTNSLVLAGNNAPLQITSGEVAGLINSRDTVLGGFLDQLNHFAGTLAFEFNKIYSSGQGLQGYSSVTSTLAVDDVNAPLDAAGLNFTPGNGQFDIQVYDPSTQLTQTSTIRLDLNGLGSDTSLTDLVNQLNAVSGVKATITPDRRLSIQSSSPDEQIAFANDTSGILASLGINTFFTGSDANSLSVNQEVIDNPSTFAASAGGVGADTNVAVQLAGFNDLPLPSQSGATLSQMYDRVASDVSQGSAVAQNLADSAQTFQQSLNTQNLAISGVSIDDETVKMMEYQRAYQASAEYISTINSLLQTLVNL